MGNVLTSKGFKLVPDILGAQRQGLNLRAQQQQLNAQQQQFGRQEQSRELSGQLLGPQSQDLTQEEKTQTLAQLFTADPKTALAVQELLGLDTPGKLREAANFAFRLQRTPFAQRDALIDERVQSLGQDRNASDTASLRGLNEQDQNIALETVQLLQLSPQQRLEVGKGKSLKKTVAQLNFETLKSLPQGTEEETQLRREFANISGAREKRATLEERTKIQKEVGNIKVNQAIAKARGVTTAQLEEELKLQPELEKKVAEAKILGKIRGEDIANFPKDLIKLRGKLEQSDVVVRKVGEALDKVGFFTTGFIGNAISGLAGTEAFVLRQTVQTIKANLGFDQLNSMREASKTGGALGNVTEIELELLQSSVENLDIGQDDVTLTNNLAEVLKRYKTFRKSQISDVLNKAKQLGIKDPLSNIDLPGVETQKVQSLSNEEGVIMVDAQGNRARVFADGTFEEL